MTLPNIHILGIQGSGKGTQSALLVEKYAFLYLASGNLFRARSTVGDDFGNKIAAQMAAGHLLPDAYLYHTVIDTLKENEYPNGILGDGIIRTMEQYSQLSQIWDLMNLDAPLLIHLRLDEATAQERISHRTIPLEEAAKEEYHRTYSGKLAHRKDDNPAALKERFAIFHAMTEPLIAHFATSKRYICIDANQDVETIHTHICTELTPFYPHIYGTY